MSATSEAVSTAGAYVGQAGLQTPNDTLSAVFFAINQIIAGKAFCAVVKVLAISGGGVGKPARATVQPMVNQVDGLGNQTPHGPIYDIPCFRLQGGGGAVILDPVVNDIGVAVICDRDISNVKSTGAISGPGSFRQNDWADGCYFGGFLNGAPTTYAQLNGDNINIVCPGTLTINAASIVTTGTLTNNGKAVGSTHEHNAPAGGGNTSPPL